MIASDPAPTWEELIIEADVVFVGRAVATLPPSIVSDKDRVVFAVEQWIRGGAGEYFEAFEGGDSCTATFGVGTRVIFGGWSQEGELGQIVTSALDTNILDPTVYLADPPTTEQQRQLDYLKSMTDVR
jgi:hypothetical protein